MAGRVASSGAEANTALPNVAFIEEFTLEAELKGHPRT